MGIHLKENKVKVRSDLTIFIDKFCVYEGKGQVLHGEHVISYFSKHASPEVEKTNRSRNFPLGSSCVMGNVIKTLSSKFYSDQEYHYLQGLNLSVYFL